MGQPLAAVKPFNTMGVKFNNIVNLSQLKIMERGSTLLPFKDKRYVLRVIQKRQGILPPIKIKRKNRGHLPIKKKERKEKQCIIFCPV
jgi:hypothetical protein